MADSATVGILKTMLTMDTASFDAGAKKAASATASVEKTVAGLKAQVQSLTPQAERMVKSLGGDKLLYTANSLTAAVTKLGGAQKLTDAEQAKVNATLTTAISKYKALGQEAPKAMVDLERATRKATGPIDVMSAKMAGLGAAAGVIAAQLAGQAIRSLIRFGAEAIDTAGMLVDLSAKTGLSTDTLQRLDAVAGQAGFSLDSFTSSAFKLGNRLAGGGDSVEQAVIDLREASGDLRIEWGKLQAATPDQRLLAILSALSKVSDATERNRIGWELFGRNFESIAAGLVDNFDEIARAAQVSSDAQLKALDAAGDRWAQFVKDTKAGIRTVLGELVLAGDEMKRTGFFSTLETLLRGSALGFTPGTSILALGGAAGKRLDEEAKKKSQEQTAARQTQTKAEIDYVAALKAAQGELGKLDAAERRQVLAAQQVSGEQDVLNDLVVKYGVSAKNAELVLKLLNGEMKAGEKASKDFAKSQEELAKKTDAAAASYRQFTNFIEERRIEDVQRENEAFQRHAKEATDAQIDELENEARAIERIRQETVAEDERAAAEWRQHNNFIGERMMEDEAAILEQRKQQWLDFRQFMGQLFSPLIGAATGGLFSLVTGIGGPSNEGAKQAREEYERLKKSGTASAEAITHAFQRMKQEQSGFMDRFKQWTGGILREFGRLVDELLGMWIREFLGGLISSLARSVIGNRLGNWIGQALGFGPGIMGSGGGGVLSAGGGLALSSAAGLLGGGAASVGTLAGAPILGASGALVGTVGATSNIAAGTAAGTAAGGGGAGAAIAGLATNPWTIGIAAAIGTGLLLKHFFTGRGYGFIRDQEWLRSRGLPLSGVEWGDLSRENQASFRQRILRFSPRIAASDLGGFTPPRVDMPSMGSRTAGLIAPVTPTASPLAAIRASGDRNVNITIHAIDAQGIRQFVRSREFTESVSFAFENNDGFMTSRLRRSLAP